MPDPCEFLTPTPAPAHDPELRRRTLNRTLGVLRRRRWLRRVAWAAVLAACYAAGVLTTHWLRPAPSAPPEVVRVEPTPTSKVDEPRPEPVQPDLVGAADHLLAERSDPLGALHGYAKALDEGGDAALTISTDDSYLMLAIKDARQKEKRDAKKLD